MYRKYKHDIEQEQMGSSASKKQGNVDLRNQTSASSCTSSSTPSSTSTPASNASTSSTLVPKPASTSCNSTANTASASGAAAGIQSTSNDVAVTAPKNTMTEAQKIAQMTELDDLLKKTKEIEDMHLGAMRNRPTDTNRAKALHVDISKECPSPSKIVRIFTSSTFTDTRHERNTLMKEAYPLIKEHCKSAGYEFQVVDMRWGVRDEATDDHMGTELCLKELKLCKNVSTGPYFVSLLSHKYGYRNFPRVVPANDFNAILGGVDSKEATQLFQKWYTLDKNSVPESYVLASVSTHIPEFVSQDLNKRKTGKDQWWKEREVMQDAMATAANKVFDREKAREYCMSITETEVQDGMLKSDAKTKYALWLKREIDDIEEQEGDYTLSRYIECTGPEDKWRHAREMLKELKDKKMMKKLEANQILSFHLNWCSNGGINPDEDPRHKEYLDAMCKAFVDKMKDLIGKSIAERARTEDSLLDDCYQHIRFCQSKCEGFFGRESELQAIKEYITGNSNQIFVIHGVSGSGKTSLLAMAAKKTEEWLGKGHVVVLRFLGTSPDSSSLSALLQSVVAQIRAVYGMKEINTSMSLETMQLLFKHSMMLRKSNRKLVLFLDSLDQLDPANEARKLTWLIHLLTPTTKIVVSTLPEPEYESFPALKASKIPDQNFLPLGVMKPEVAQTICENWLATRNRCLTDQQMSLVLDAYQKCPTLLFLKLSIEEATRWTSFMPIDQTVLQNTVRASIDHLFARLEKIHGKILVSRALSYLTQAHNGASEAELEDILSCDDDVLNDVYMYWTPPTRRLPPLLLVRIRHDLDQFLVERGADGVRVLYWYHRQFIEAAVARYCSDQDQNKLIHSNLANFFNGKWANGRKKSFVTKKGEKGAEDRYVAQQPLKYKNNIYNIRAMNNLPYHCLRAEQLDMLKSQCLANISFILHKLQALPTECLMDDYLNALSRYHEDQLISPIYEALCLSQKGISHDPVQVIPQLLGRLVESKETAPFLEACRRYRVLRLEPSKNILTQPGGQLIHCIIAHKHKVRMMDLTPDGCYALTVCQEEKALKIWNVKEGKIQRNVAGVEQCYEARFCHNGEWIVIERSQFYEVQEVLSGRRIGILPGTIYMITVAGKNQDLVCFFEKEMCTVFDVSQDCKQVAQITAPENKNFCFQTTGHGTENYVAVMDDDQLFIFVLDLRTNTFISTFRAFPQTKDEDGELEDNKLTALAIFPDETHLAYVSMFTCEVMFADFQGNRLRSIPANEDSCFTSITFSKDGRLFLMRDRKKIKIFDTATLQQVACLDHLIDILDERSNDMQTILTIGEDCKLMIWDRSRPILQQNNSDIIWDNFEIEKCLLLVNSRYVLLCVTEKKGDSSKWIMVFDIIEDKVVKQSKIPFGIKLHRTQDPDIVAVETYKEMFLVHVPTLTLKCTVQGVLTARVTEDNVSSDNRLVTLSRGRKNIKIINLDTGKVMRIIKMNIEGKDRISKVKTNKQGTLAYAKLDGGKQQLLVDLENGTVRKSFKTGPDFGQRNMFGGRASFTPDGKFLLFGTEIDLPGIKGSVMNLVVIDTNDGTIVTRLVDREYEEKYDKFGSFESTEVEKYCFLDDNHVIQACSDNIVRIFNIITGVLIRRLEGHTSSVTLAVQPNADYIVSFGHEQEDNCLKLWNKSDFDMAASFTLDKKVMGIEWSSDGSFLLTHGTADITVWNLTMAGQVQNQYQRNFKMQISGEVECTPLYFRTLPTDEGDPDSDPEGPLYYDSDDDDEDSQNDK